MSLNIGVLNIGKSLTRSSGEVENVMNIETR